RRREWRPAVRPIAELRELTLTGEPDYAAFEWVAESSQLSTLRVLTVRGLFGESLAQLVVSPHLARLRALRLPSNNLGNEGLHALAQSSTLTALEELDYSAMARHERYIHDPMIRAAGMGGADGVARPGPRAFAEPIGQRREPGRSAGLAPLAARWRAEGALPPGHSAGRAGDSRVRRRPVRAPPGDAGPRRQRPEGPRRGVHRDRPLPS